MLERVELLNWISVRGLTIKLTIIFYVNASAENVSEVYTLHEHFLTYLTAYKTFSVLKVKIFIKNQPILSSIENVIVKKFNLKSIASSA